ncbi:methyltransferase [Luteimonas sp. 50]|uniref:Methyltransferase n=1 Tax=Cognatiluteimonas sedimenti TaxID=2927791 RepID=A0ABT0A2U1_9GAMM|nr:methyltransferase [Lysobacter sedimenti]MCJ0825276.1 methyltransferase [Lysobacter sedimenti]
MKWTLALAFGLALAPAAAQTPAIPDYVAKAVADPARGEDAKADERRHIGEIMAFAGVKPGDKVLELVPGSGYWSRVFAKIVGPQGRVYGAVPEPMKKYSDETITLPDSYPNVEVLVQPADALAAPAPVDVVFTVQNYHDYPDKFMGPTDPAILNKAVFAALKPGGTYIVVDHVAEAGSGLRDTDTLHRIDPALVKQQVEAAGFEYVGESEVLRNPADTHKLKVFDDAIRGHTDQFAYKFRKPMAAQDAHAMDDMDHAHDMDGAHDMHDMAGMEEAKDADEAQDAAPAKDD